jgi:hypothetical protein
MAIASGWATAQGQTVEKHVPGLAAEFKARYPQGVADSPLCQRAKQQRPPYSRLRVYGLERLTLENDLSDLMRKSDEVVMVGTTLRAVTVLTPSGEDALSYTDVRILHSWKGTHKIGEVTTLEMPEGFLGCGPSHVEFSGTQVGPLPEVGYHTPSHAYSPDGPYLLFLRHATEESEIKVFRLAGGNGLQGFFDLIPDQIISGVHSPYASCFLASYDPGWCHSDPHGRSPEWCRNSKIDAQNISQCNEVVRVGEDAIFVHGVDQDRLRQKYQGQPGGSFLRALDSAAAELTNTQTLGPNQP